MQAGKLDRLVTFQREVTEVDAANAAVNAGWAVILADVPAQRTAVSDGERNFGAQVDRLVTDRFTVRWHPDLAALKAGDQLVDDGQAYRVVGLKEIGRRRALEVSACARPDLESA